MMGDSCSWFLSLLSFPEVSFQCFALTCADTRKATAVYFACIYDIPHSDCIPNKAVLSSVPGLLLLKPASRSTAAAGNHHLVLLWAEPSFFRHHICPR